MSAASADSTRVEPKGTGSARPRHRTLKSPGKRPNPKRSSSRESPENSTSARTVVISHFSMVGPWYPAGACHAFGDRIVAESATDRSGHR